MVSTGASKCPHCGQRNPTMGPVGASITLILSIIFAIIFGIVILCFC